MFKIILIIINLRSVFTLVEVNTEEQWHLDSYVMSYTEFIQD